MTKDLSVVGKNLTAIFINLIAQNIDLYSANWFDSKPSVFQNAGGKQ